ncbi:MAG TPA: RIP metalloprotease RseP [Chthoniobacterales bacterium]|jgi:regulator of sigma E protease|nr:RIP metalloprotease RseP [Chthoniobacterales bacterium]
MIGHVLRVIFIVLEVLILFNLLIVVHELGHFLAARWRGLFIEGFGVWFGKPLWKKTINGVQYSLGSLPFGGFVKLPQLAPMDMIEGKADMDRAVLPKISALDKIIVAFAGPLFSVLLALFFACVVWAVGHPVSESDLTTVIGYVQKDSPAAKAGLQPGDKILEVDGRPVSRFFGMNDSVVWNIVRSEGPSIPFKVERDGKVLTVDVVPMIAETSGWRRKSTRQVLIQPAVTPLVDGVDKNTPAEKAGVKIGDIVTAVNGKRIYNALSLVDEIDNHPTDELALDVQRGSESLQLKMRPVPLESEGVTKPRLGIRWETGGQLSLSHPDPVEQVYNSITSTLQTIGAVASPKSDVKLQHMSGPVMIVRIYYMLFEGENGWKLALWFSVILNVNLAILNMLPIPVLDGGHIVLALIESVRRKPVNMKILEWVQTACATLIIGYMLYISFFDIGDLFGKNSDRRSPVKTPPAKTQSSPSH